MKNFKNFFQLLSYLQYPLMGLALVFAVKPYFQGFDYLKENPDVILDNFNAVLIFMGIGISFSTLQDTRKTQNNFSKKIWQNPKKGKIAIAVMATITGLCLGYGVFGYFISDTLKVQQLSFGFIVFGIGLIGFLKTGLEIFENHRTDKHPGDIDI